MQKYISTNIQISPDLWKAVKIKAAEEGKSMKELIVEGLLYIIGRSQSSRGRGSVKTVLLKYSHKETSPLTDGSVHHDKYIYGK